MLRSGGRFTKQVAVIVFLASADLGVPAGAQPGTDGGGPADWLGGDLTIHKMERDRGRPIRILVSPGNEAEADAYYGSIARDFVHVAPDIFASTLQDVLTYCGFPSIGPRDAEGLDSRTLMGLAEEDQILATVFFAPKIVDVSGQTDPIQYGWRKLVRLRATSTSPAARDGIRSAFVLFNFADEAPRFPDVPAGQIQVILVRDPRSTVGFPVYFLVYGGQPDYRIKKFLNASFDGATAKPNERYFVPRACAECHGVDPDSGLERVKLNYLDTDHWFDRVEKGNDFPAVKRRHVLPDAGTPLFFWRFNRAFDVLRKVNREIRDQNVEVDPGSFQVRAVDRWLELHRSTSRHIEPLKRALPGTSSPVEWDEDNANDAALLPLMNRYCFRCHSSFKYHVFDKEAVKGLAKGQVPQDYVHYGFMPQDRQLDEDLKAQIIELLNRLAAEPD